MWMMVIGGYSTGGIKDSVEIVSLDAIKHPVPECFRKRSNFPRSMQRGAGFATDNGV